MPLFRQTGGKLHPWTGIERWAYHLRSYESHLQSLLYHSLAGNFSTATETCWQPGCSKNLCVLPSPKAVRAGIRHFDRRPAGNRELLQRMIAATIVGNPDSCTREDFLPIPVLRSVSTPLCVALSTTYSKQGDQVSLFSTQTRLNHMRITLDIFLEARPSQPRSNAQCLTHPPPHPRNAPRPLPPCPPGE